MALRPLTPSTQATARTHLDRLLATLYAIPNPDEAFDPALLSYTMFPLTHLLGRNNPARLGDPAETGYIPDGTIERVLECVGFLVRRWRRCGTGTGMDGRMWEQWWRVAVRVVQGSAGRRRAEEAEVKAVELIAALLDSPTEEETRLVIPSPESQSQPPPRLLPLLFHTISTLIERATDGTSPTLIQRTLETLDAIIRDWFTHAEHANVLASIMPGLVSSLVKLICGNPPANPPSAAQRRAAFQSGWNDVLSVPSGTARGTRTRTTTTLGTRETCAAVQLVVRILVQTIGDGPLGACGVLSPENAPAAAGAAARDLSGLFDDLVVDAEEEERTVIGSPTVSEATTTAATATTTTVTGDPFPRLTPAYLAYTRTQVLVALQAILPRLAGHHAARVRRELVRALETLALECRRACWGDNDDDERIPELVLSTLLGLGSPYQPDPTVTHAAQGVLRRLLRESPSQPPPPSCAGPRAWRAVTRATLEREVRAFPRAVVAHSEQARVEASVGVLSALAGLALAPSPRGTEGGHADAATAADDDDVAAALRRDFGRLLGPEGSVHKWSGPLLRCLELGRPVEMEQDDATPTDSRPWDMGRIGAPDPATTGPEQFPRLFLAHVESHTTSDRIGHMFEALGAAAGVGSLHTVEHLIRVARASRSSSASTASSAVWLIARIVDGLAGVAAGAEWVDGKRLRRAARRVVELVVEFDEDDIPPQEEATDSPPPGGEEEPLALVERRRGLGTIGKLLDDSKRTPASATEHARRLHNAVHAQLVICINLALLASCARILSTSFRKHLISTLYIILSHLGSPHALVRRYAHVALGQVAYHAGYASAQNLILENVDYVINIVSQRMTYDRLDTLAPVVLISMIRLVGEPIVPLVQDIIADVFDALDDFHGYALLASTVLAVMDTLMKAMAGEVAEDDAPTASTSVRLRRAPDPKWDVERFTAWYAERAVKARQTMDELLERAPHEPWDRPKDESQPDDGPANASNEKETPPTRAQEVCIQMMQKSIYFITHANPFITARVLSLFASGVPVLVTQGRESDALPLVHQAWPFILNRLQDPTPFVRTEAAALVECLARWTGDFMSRRILDDAWPLFRQLLDAQKQRDEHSALAVRGVRGTTSAYTVSHRLYLSIIRAMHLVVRRVPIADDLFWEIVLALRPFLDARVHQELGAATVKLYRAMAERDEDAVWLALNATMGTVIAGQRLPRYLQEPGLDIRHRVELVL